MKKRYLIYFFLVLVSITSCNNENKPENIEPQNNKKVTSQEKEAIKNLEEKQEIKLVASKTGFIISKNKKEVIPAIKIRLKNISGNSISYGIKIDVVFFAKGKKEVFDRNSDFLRVSVQDAWDFNSSTDIFITSNRQCNCLESKSNLRVKIILTRIF